MQSVNLFLLPWFLKNNSPIGDSPKLGVDSFYFLWQIARVKVGTRCPGAGFGFLRCVAVLGSLLLHLMLRLGVWGSTMAGSGNMVGGQATQRAVNIPVFDSGLRVSVGRRTDLGGGVVRSKIDPGTRTTLGGRTVSGRAPRPTKEQVAILNEADALLTAGSVPTREELGKAHDLLKNVMYAKNEDGILMEAEEPQSTAEDIARGGAIAANKLGAFYLRYEIQGLDGKTVDGMERAKVCFQRAIAAGDDDAGNGYYHLGKFWMAHLENALRGGTAMDSKLLNCADVSALAIDSFRNCNERRMHSGLEATPGALIGIAYALCVSELRDLPTRDQLIKRLKSVEGWDTGEVPEKFSYHLGKFAYDGFLRMCETGVPDEQEIRQVDGQTAADLQGFIDNDGGSADPDRVARAHNILGLIEHKAENYLAAVRHFLSGLSGAPQRIFRHLYKYFTAGSQDLSAAVVAGSMTRTSAETMLEQAGKVVVINSKEPIAPLSSKSVKPPKEDAPGCKSELAYTWYSDGKPLVARSEKRVPKVKTDEALISDPSIRTATENPVPSVLESHAAYKVLVDTHAQLKELHPKLPEEKLLEKLMKRPDLPANSGWNGEVTEAVSGPRHVVRSLHDGLGVKEFDEMSTANLETGNTVLGDVCPTLNSIFALGEGEGKKGILLPMTVNPGTFSHNGWYSSLNGQDENRHQMTNNVGWRSEWHIKALPEVEVAHAIDLKKYGLVGGKEVRGADPRRLESQKIPDGARVVLAFDVQKALRGSEVACETVEGWSELKHESECRGVTGFDVANSLNNDVKIEQTVSDKMGSNPQMKLLNTIHKTTVLIPASYSKSGGPPRQYEEFASVGAATYTESRQRDFVKRVHTDGLLASDRTRTRAKNEFVIDLVRTADAGVKPTYTFVAEDSFDKMGHYMFTEGGHSVRCPHQMTYMKLLDKTAAQAERELPKNTLMVRHSDHAGDVYGGYAHYHADQSAHGQKNTFTQRTAFMSLNYTGEGAKKIAWESVLQMPAIYDLPIIESSASNKKIELVGDERMTFAGELAVDLSEGMQLSKDVDYIYSPNYVPKSGQELLYKFYVKTARTPSVNYVMEAGRPQAFEGSDRGKAALEGGKRYVEDMKQTRSYNLLVQEKARLKSAQLNMLGYIVEHRALFPNFQDRDIAFLHDLAQVDGIADYRGMHSLGWETGESGGLGPDARQVYEEAIIHRVKGLMDATAGGQGFTPADGFKPTRDYSGAVGAFVTDLGGRFSKEISPHVITDGNIPKSGSDQHPMFRSQAQTAKKWGQDHRPDHLKLGSDGVDTFRSNVGFPSAKASALPGILVEDGILGGSGGEVAQLRSQVEHALVGYDAQAHDVDDENRVKAFTQIRENFIRDFKGIPVTAYPLPKKCQQGGDHQGDHVGHLLVKNQYLQPNEIADGALRTRFLEYLNSDAIREEIASACFRSIVMERASCQLEAPSTQ